ncbi:hypothetical protein D8674_028593 [Pyrus ussuriensis x Pyrus communis]|uniref:Uncharacterized protein n=1 Tax=Pyrus ussuriensis x Pyrus communis TaxID=2448454 RepID=A0A5N5HWQ1_9ROSA|nr:hypothetical protein D8674_028593 [Pyrus ussuriensis x Pyrus communis]
MLANSSFLTFLFIHGLLLHLLVVMSESRYMAPATATPQDFSGLHTDEFTVVSRRVHTGSRPPSPKHNMPSHYRRRKYPPPIHFLPPPERYPPPPPQQQP